MPYVELGCRCLLALVFIVAVMSKAAGPARFARFRTAVTGMCDDGRWCATVVRPVAVSVLVAEAGVPVSLLGFVASLAVLSPIIALVVVCGGIPVFVAELALSRQRAATYWRVSPRLRRELFYSTLLTSLQAAKEIRLFGIGVFLSGGQWQRLALARALFRNHGDLLILDEPSAGLDAMAKYEIQAALRTYRAGRTSLLISHRLGAIRDAEKIVVLDDGVVSESGDHDALMEARGTYAQLFELQARGYQPSLVP